MTSRSVFLAVDILVCFSGCVSMRQPMPGLIYSDTSAGESTTGNSAGNRVGEACSQSYFGLVSPGDATVEAARRNGGITMISSVDETFKNYFFFYGKYCTV